MAGAVETAHRPAILHRDIKPANILFTEFGRPALTDFGISVTTTHGQSSGGEGMSIPWAPPEQLRSGSPMGAPGDVYSLAATLWTSLVGHSPFHLPGGDNTQIALAHRVRNDTPPPIRRDDAPESLQRVLGVALAKSPADRYATALDARTGTAERAGRAAPPGHDDRRAGQHGRPAAEVPDTESGTRITGFVAVDPENKTSRPAPIPAAPASVPEPPRFVTGPGSPRWTTPRPVVDAAPRPLSPRPAWRPQVRRGPASGRRGRWSACWVQWCSSCSALSARGR